MSQKLKGNLKGLKASQLKALQKLFSRSLESTELVSLDLAREVYRTAAQIGRRIGLLISREGQVAEVCVGDREILYLPDLGRYRFGRARLRRLRLIFSDLSKKERDSALIPADIYADLEKLRLDAVVSVREGKNRMAVCWAHLKPPAASTTSGMIDVQTEQIGELEKHELDFGEFITGLESELESGLSETARLTKDLAILVGVYPKNRQDADMSMRELEELARTAGLNVAECIVQRRDPDPKTVLGKGKLEEVVLRCLALGAEMIVFDAELKPSQWLAIINSTELKVIDRSMLILDIFAQRAQSSDGRLQVELAQLKYNLPRLVERDTGLSRLSGGIGGRGPGETKIEEGRRSIKDRISDLEKRIDRLSSQRELRRKRRRDSKTPLVSIVGYTNVGKSTLFNALARSDVLVENKLFATLDPAQRRIVYPLADAQCAPWQLEFVLADTVGFIRNLPVELGNAFRATLEELAEADVLLHVLDVSDPAIKQRRAAVEATLSELKLGEVPRIQVLNKTDLLQGQDLAPFEREFDGISVSALERQGFSEIYAAIARHLSERS